MASRKFMLLLQIVCLEVFLISSQSKVSNTGNHEKLKAHKHGETLENSMPSMVASMIGTHLDGGKSKGFAKDQSSLLEWSMNLDNSNKYRLDWSYDYPGNSIKFALRINENASTFRDGFDIFGVGFSERGESLASSDFCILWFDLSHRAHLQDGITNSSNTIELIDESQSVCKLLPVGERGKMDSTDDEFPERNRKQRSHKRNKKRRRHWSDSQTGAELEIYFSRPLDVCLSKRAYYSIDNGTTHLLWFNLRGPLLTIDGLNLTQQEQQRETSLFEWGLNRVQLIANKPSFVGYESLGGKPSGASSDGQQGETDSKEDAKAEEATERLAEAEIMRSQHFKMDKFKVPARETTYWCKLFKLPRKFLAKRYHITKYGPTIEPGNEHVVHHMELFNCANLDGEQLEQLEELVESGGWSGECGNLENRPKVTLSCRKVIMAWAMGAHPLEYPNLVGQSIGGHGYAPYVVLEIHYNNPSEADGFIDSSGLTFDYTNKLRPYEAGILEVGLEYTDKYAIPPNLITPLAGYCVSECTRVGLLSPGSVTSATTSGSAQKSHTREESLYLESMKEEEDKKVRRRRQQEEPKEDSEGIYIFAAQLHTHLAGLASWTEIVREGKLLGELQRDQHYSPHFQEIRYLAKPVHLVPGDALIHYCLYDTRNRLNVTLGGESTSDEMCVTYLHYYPRKELEVCKSSVDSEALEDYFAYLANYENQNTSFKLANLDHGNHTNVDHGSSKTFNAISPMVSDFLVHGMESGPPNSSKICEITQIPLS